jgi:ubiquitin-conjugating enzyme E2 M
LNILREDWKPVLSISSVIYGLLHLFLEPNPNDPLNHEAAEELRRSPQEFGRLVYSSLRGGFVQNVQYPRLLRS